MNRMWWGLICVGLLANSSGCRTCNGDRARLISRDNREAPPARPASSSRDDRNFGQLNRMRTAADPACCAPGTTAMQPGQPFPLVSNPGGYPPGGFVSGPTYPPGGFVGGPTFGQPGGFAPTPIRPNELPMPGLGSPTETIPPTFVPATPMATPPMTFRPGLPSPIPLTPSGSPVGFPK